MRADDLLAEAFRRAAGDCNRRCWPLGSNDEEDACISGFGCSGIRGLIGRSRYAVVRLGCHYHLPLPYLVSDHSRHLDYKGFCQACNNAVAETFNFQWPGDGEGFVQNYSMESNWYAYWSGRDLDALARSVWNMIDPIINGFKHDMETRYARVREKFRDLQKKFGIQGTVPSFRHYFLGEANDPRPAPPRCFGPQERHALWLPLLDLSGRRHRRQPAGLRDPQPPAPQ